MALFTDTETDKLTMPSEVNALQDHFTLLLSRYLCEQVGRSNATKLIPQYKSAIKSLQEMAHIFTQKRLKLWLQAELSVGDWLNHLRGSTLNSHI